MLIFYFSNNSANSLYDSNGKYEGSFDFKGRFDPYGKFEGQISKRGIYHPTVSFWVILKIMERSTIHMVV